MGRDERKIFSLSAIFFLLYVLYAFWSGQFLNPDSRFVSPFVRCIIVLLLMTSIMLILRRKSHYHSLERIKEYFVVPFSVVMIIYLFFTILSWSFNLANEIRVVMPVLTYFYLAALSCGIWKTRIVGFISWLIMIILQLLIDLFMYGRGLYGPVHSFHI